tara:strand:- start:192 stop:5156 length:4965 start_codon:yes stop_codon:yes gene_type:complete
MSTPSEAKSIILSNSYYSIGFPSIEKDSLVNREHLLLELNNYFEKGAEVIFVQGEEESGKTVLTAQYALKNDSNTISIFFNPNNNLDFEIGFFCTNFINQAKHMLGEEVNEEKFYTVEDLQRYRFPLRKHLRKKKNKINLVIDGLENVLQKHISFVKELFTIIPLGDSSFQLVISGNQNEFFKLIPNLKKFPFQILNLTGFSPSEMTDYLKAGKISPEEITDLYKITKGLPGRLKFIRRMADTENISLNDISSTTSFTHWLEKDCDSVDISNETENMITSLLCLGGKALDIDQISEICQLEKDVVAKFIQKVPIFENVDGEIRFTSSSHKKYFENLLRANKKMIDELLMQFYANDANNVLSHVELTKLHANSKQWDKVLDIINEEHLPRIIETTGSLQMVNESLLLGLRASESLHKYAELWRFSLQGGIVNELDNYQFWESEVIARISLQDFSGAIDLASTAILNIDRLRLYALIARKQKEIKKTVDEDLIKSIQDLYSTTDIYTLGDKIYDVVADLLYAIPNLAIEIIENSSNTNEETDINDWILTKLSLAAIKSSDSSSEDGERERKEEAVESLGKEKVRKINKAIAFLVGNYTSKKVIKEVKKLSEPRERLRLLRIWLTNKKNNNKDIEEVLALALDEIVQISSSESTTYDSLSDLSQSLPWVKDLEKKHKLLTKFLQLERHVSDIGLTTSKYIYKLNIFHVQYQLEPKKSKKVLNAVIEEAKRIEDPLVQLDGFSEIFSKLSILNDKELIGTSKFIYAKIINLCKELFDETAHHDRIVSYSLKTISNKNPVLGLKICEYINTLKRRENAKLMILESYLENKTDFINLSLVNEIENSLVHNRTKKEFYLIVLDRFSEAKTLNYNTIKKLLPIIGDAIKLTDPFDRLNALLSSYVLISKNKKWSESTLLQSIGRSITNTLDCIESEWQRVELGYFVSSELAKINSEFSQKIFEETIKLKNDSWLYSEKVATTYILSLKIIIRAYGALLGSNQQEANHFNTLESLINRISSAEERIKLWTEVGFCSIINEKDNLGKQILDNHIIPIIMSLESKKSPLQNILYSLVYIHIFNPELGRKYIEQVDEEYLDVIYGELTMYFLSKRNPYFFYEGLPEKFSCSFSDINRVLDVLENTINDSSISYQTRIICHAIKNNQKPLSDTQISVMTDRLEKIIDEKLPDKNNLQHDGYKLLARARIASVKRRNVNKSLWIELLDEVDKIPNTSDKVLVKAVLLEIIPFEKVDNGKQIKRDLYETVVQKIRDIKVHYEFVQRVLDVTEIMYKVHKTDWEEVVKDAFNLSGSLKDGGEALRHQKNIINTMHKLNPDYAKNLVKSLDEVSKRENLNDLLRDYYDGLIIADKIKNNEDIEQKTKAKNQQVFRAVFSSLKSINSEKIPPKKVAEISKLLHLGPKGSMHETFPVFAYYIANCSKTYKASTLTGSVKNIHTENFEQSVKAAELIRLLSYTKKNKFKVSKKLFLDTDFTTGLFVRPNSREEAINFIKEWLEENVSDFIVIADPYFEKTDLEILKVISHIVSEDVEINILGSKDGWLLNNEESFRDYWDTISGIEPPFTNLTFCWIPEKGNDTPFHDRHIITGDKGLSLGTSLNSLGMNKESFITVLKPSNVSQVYDGSLAEYIHRSKKVYNNQRLKYRSFSL